MNQVAGLAYGGRSLANYSSSLYPEKLSETYFKIALKVEKYGKEYRRTKMPADWWLEKAIESEAKGD